eukprot:6711532-Pyramimonas_sp.AAC.1
MPTQHGQIALLARPVVTLDRRLGPLRDASCTACAVFQMLRPASPLISRAVWRLQVALQSRWVPTRIDAEFCQPSCVDLLCAFQRKLLRTFS